MYQIAMRDNNNSYLPQHVAPVNGHNADDLVLMGSVQLSGNRVVEVYAHRWFPGLGSGIDPFHEDEIRDQDDRTVLEMLTIIPSFAVFGPPCPCLYFQTDVPMDQLMSVLSSRWLDDGIDGVCRYDVHGTPFRPLRPFDVNQFSIEETTDEEIEVRFPDPSQWHL